MNEAMKQQFIHNIKLKLAEACSLFKIADFNADTVEVHFDIRGRCAGRARRRGKVYSLHFNPEAVNLYNEQMTKDTIPHEVAHLVCFSRRDLGSNHDLGWKRVCRQLGGDDSRTHSMELTPAKVVTRYPYDVFGHIIQVGPKHHKQIQSGERWYSCRHPTRGKVEIVPQMYVHHAQQDTKVYTFNTAARTSAPNPQPVQAQSTAPTTGSKREIAEAIYKANRHLPRGEVIKLFISQAGLTPAGASTYYQNFKKAGI